MLIINEERLLKRIHTLGAVGLDADGRRTRLAASDEDKAGRNLVSRWMSEAGLTVVTDYIGNLFGIWVPEGCADAAPLMLGSHIDTVINAGQFDGCYGVLAALEVVETLKASGFVPARPIAIGAFTNEEGVRYAPDMMGSLVYAGGYPLEKALASVGTDGTVLGEELRRIGYAGTVEPGFLKPCAFVELHIEQGPILDAEGISIGAVENLQGISWQRVTIEGEQNHAGTTPTAYRVDAGLAAAKVITFLRVADFRSKITIPVGCEEFPDVSFLCGKTLNELLDAELHATEYALLKAAKPSWMITLPEVNAYTLGQLMYFFEMQTAYAGELLDVDAFNQPGVEEGKNAAYALLGRKGYETKAIELDARPESDTRYVL